MRAWYAAAFGFIGAGFTASALLRGGAWWVALWPGVSFLAVAAAYGGGGARVFGKGAGGRFAPWAIVLLGPFMAFTWLAWHLVRLVARDPAGQEVAPGVWLGRRAGAHELPPGTTLVVDLTCEMWPPRRLAVDGRAYVCLPTLDGTPPDDAALADFLRHVADAPGTLYIHCARGRGRSAALAAALLIARGAAGDVTEAEAALSKARSVVRLNRAQRAWVARATAGLKAPQGGTTSPV